MSFLRAGNVPELYLNSQHLQQPYHAGLLFFLTFHASLGSDSSTFKIVFFFATFHLFYPNNPSPNYHHLCSWTTAMVHSLSLPFWPLSPTTSFSHTIQNNSLKINQAFTKHIFKKALKDFPDGPEVNNPPCNARDAGSTHCNYRSPSTTTRVCVSQGKTPHGIAKIPRAATKTWHSQIKKALTSRRYKELNSKLQSKKHKGNLKMGKRLD